MSYANITNPANFQLQDFAQFGFRVITTDFIPVPGEQYRTLYVLQDAVVTATTQKGDDITSKAILAGTLLHGLFNGVSITSGRVLAYAAGRVTAEEIIALYEAYVIALGGTLENAQCAVDTINEDGVDFFADASLVMIPEGYATGVVYGQRPLTSDSQLTFTRASDATRVGPDGAIEKVRTNLVLQSEAFDNAAWTKTNATITDNATAAPDGTLTADKLVETAALGDHAVARVGGMATAGIYTLSVFAKAGERTRIAIGNSSAAHYAIFDLSLGTVVQASQGTVTNGTISSIDANGFYRVSCTITVASAASAVFNLVSTGTTISYTGDGTSGLFIWGAQLETGDIATSYIPTTTTAVSVGILSNVPRIDYTGGGCGKLLLEPQRTNLVTFSEQMDNAVWTKSGCTATANNTISPSGYQDADEINMAAPDASLLRQIITVTASTAYTFSFYVKRGTATNLRYNVRDITNSTDITAKVDYTSQTSTTQWNRISVTFTTPVGCTSVGVFPNRDSSSAGTFYIWGAQLEAGSYATSYIPTLGSSVTRLADTCSKTGISNLIGQTQGTLFLDFIYKPVFDTTQTSYRASISDGTYTGRVSIVTENSNTLSVVITGVSLTGSTFPIVDGQRYKIAIGYGATTDVYINGAKVYSYSSGTPTGTYTRFQFSDATGLASRAFAGPINQALLFKTRLTNEQLQKLTTL
jgi:hypothetical protein